MEEGGERIEKDNIWRWYSASLRKIHTLDTDSSLSLSSCFTSFVAVVAVVDEDGDDDEEVEDVSIAAVAVSVSVAAAAIVVVVVVVDDSVVSTMAADASFVCCFEAAVGVADGESPDSGGNCCCCCWRLSGDALSALTIIAIFGLFLAQHTPPPHERGRVLAGCERSRRTNLIH